MEYLSLYRKWRPKRFDEGFVGQEHLVRTLKNAIVLNKVAHAYLFNGPRGTGKTTAAKILAKSLNCVKRGDDPNPCNNCPNCEKINTGVSLDVLEIDGASNRGIDEVRDLREKIKFAPVEGEYKVYIIDEVHMLTTEAFNALLKTLEEPPSHIIFIFATTEIHKVPATILSRCQRFDFKRLSPEEIFRHLNFLCEQEGFKAEETALKLIAREAGGGLRDAIGLLEQSVAHADGDLTFTDAQAILGLIDTEALFSIAQSVADQDIKAGLDLIKQVLDGGKDLQLFARQVARFFRDLIVLHVAGEDAPIDLDQVWKAQGYKISGEIGLSLLKKGVDLFLEAGMGVRRGIEGSLPLEMALIQLISQKEPRSDLSSLEARLSALEERLRSVCAEIETNSSSTDTVKPRENARKQIEVSQTGGNALDAQKNTADSSSERTNNEDAISTVNWENVLTAVRKRRRTVEALLREGKPGGHRSGKFVIEFSPEFKFHWENIKRSDNLRLVEEAIREVSGLELTVECLLKEKSAQARSNQDKTLNGEPEILRNTLDLFGGKVIESDQ